MRLAAGGEAFPHLPAELAVQLIAGLGFEGYDLIIKGGGGEGAELDQVRADVAAAAKRYAERVRGVGLEFADVFCVPADGLETFATNHPQASERVESRAIFDDLLDLCVELGAPGLTILPGIDWPDETHEVSLARSAAELQDRALTARARGIRLSVEPHIGSVCPTPKDVWRLCELAPDLELTFDYTHYTVQGFEDSELEPLIAKARHFHARGSRKGRMQAPMRENEIDYGRVIDAMREFNYDGFIGMDYVWVDIPGLNDIDVLSETVMIRDLLRAKVAGEEWSYPSTYEIDFGEISEP